MSHHYRIHGDNIIECELALEVIVDALQYSGVSILCKPEIVNSTSFAPILKVVANDQELFFEFFPGHGRWNVSLSKYISSLGAPLREAVDAFVTKVVGEEEIPVGAFEFCSALPAGNNAWQRTGRALSMISAGIPYFYFADIGGQELDSNRNIKAPRFPNPIVPFSYLAATSSSPEQCLTIYLPSPSISEETYDEFSDAFGNDNYKSAIASIFEVTSTDKGDVEGELEDTRIKSSNFILNLVERRRSNNTYSLDTWKNLLYNASHSLPIANLMKDNSLGWSKRISIKSTSTLPGMIANLKSIGVFTVGSSDMPFCLLPGEKRRDFADMLVDLYGDSVSEELLGRIRKSTKDLVITFIAGFKPRGDDSRPDRGLTPLARMVFANDDVEFLGVVYGPASRDTWYRLFNNTRQLAHTNGLWESILGLSDMVIVDSPTYDTSISKRRDLVITDEIREVKKIRLNKFSPIPRYGEHDVDSTLHLLFSRAEKYGVHEALCNPPGGDWSGISIVDGDGASNRWTSLPRVTGVDGKRPDHIIQFADKNLILSIESKDILPNLEQNIGPRLNQYTSDLLSTGAAQARRLKDTLQWTQTIDTNALREAANDYTYFSAVAFVVKDGSSLDASLQKSRADIAIGVQFLDTKTTLYIKLSDTKIKVPFLDFLNTQKNKIQDLNINIELV